jgi:hypothetical protein
MRASPAYMEYSIDKWIDEGGEYDAHPHPGVEALLISARCAKLLPGS